MGEAFVADLVWNFYQHKVPTALSTALTGKGREGGDLMGHDQVPTVMAKS